MSERNFYRFVEKTIEKNQAIVVSNSYFLIREDYKTLRNATADSIHKECLDKHCHCEEGIFKSSLYHTISITFYLLITILILNTIIYYVGEDNIKNFLLNNKGMYFISSLIGLIPSCASSVVMTELYLSGMASLGFLMSGLLTGAGVGLLVLFKTNKSLKENIIIVTILYFVGVIIGFLIDLLGIVIV